MLIVHPDPRMAADMAGELATTGWLTAAPGTVGNGQSAVLILSATGHGGGAAAHIARIRTPAPGAPVLFLGIPGTVETLLAAGTGPGDDYLNEPFTA